MKSFHVFVLSAALSCAIFFGAAPAQSVQAAEVQTAVKAADLPKSKHTKPGLYVTAKEAAAAIAADPDAVFLDVRTVAEVVFVGAPPNAYNIPFLMFLGASQARDMKGSYKMVLNPDFVASVEQLMKKLGKDHSARLFITCRSGGRSAAAVDVLYELGYSQVYSIVDGFEGDSDKSGRHTINGWKNAGLAWTYSTSKDHQYKPPAQ